MWLTGDYLVPHINGYPYYNKPPLFNWIMAGFYQLTGSAEPWVVRLPSLLGLLGLSYTHFRFSRRYLARDRALWSALALLTAMDILFYASVNSGEIDLLCAWVVYLQAIAVFHYQQKEDFWHMYLISYVLTFVGFMLKGLPSLAFQAFTILAWLLANRQWKKLLYILEKSRYLKDTALLKKIDKDIWEFRVCVERHQIRLWPSLIVENRKHQ